MTAADVLPQALDAATQAGVFGPCRIENNMLVCEAKASAEPAFYRVSFEGETPYVSLVTEDRWLSGSIEADLVHTGDTLQELLDEELAELGFEGQTPAIEHFRSEDLLFTFRSALPDQPASVLIQVLLGYEAAFRQLGDMEESNDD